jgi:hypothetical protein
MGEKLRKSTSYDRNRQGKNGERKAVIRKKVVFHGDTKEGREKFS